MTPWIAALQASLSITNSWSSLKLRSIKLVMPSSHLILCCPLLLLPPIPPSIRVFSNESTHATIIALIPQDKENHVIHVKLVMLHQVCICSNHSSGPKKCPIHGCMDWMDTLWTRLYQVFIYCLVPIISLINEEAMLMLWFPQITSQTLCPEVFIMFGNSHFPA